MTHRCVSKLTSIDSDNGLSPGRRQAIVWTNDGISIIGPVETNFSEILIGIQTISFKKMRWKMSSTKWRPVCLGLNELTIMPFKCYWVNLWTWWCCHLMVCVPLCLLWGISVDTGGNFHWQLIKETVCNKWKSYSHMVYIARGYVEDQLFRPRDAHCKMRPLRYVLYTGN